MTADLLLHETDYETERNKPVPTLNHGMIQLNLGFSLKSRFKGRFTFASEVKLDLDEWGSVPDLIIIPLRKMDIRRDVSQLREAPLCTIEILSPSQNLADLVAKAYEYFERGVQSCWLVIPDLANIYVFSSPEEYQIFRLGEMLIDPKLDISIPVSEVFE